MGMRRTNARWFRTPVEREPFDFHEQFIIDEDARARWHKRMDELNCTQESRDRITQALIEPPLTTLGQAVTRLARLLEDDWERRQEHYFGLSDILKRVSP